MKANLPNNEQERLESLRQLDLIDTIAEPEFDELVALAAAICGTPISLITLIDERRQWFKAAVGLSARETPREIAFCAHTILESSLFTVTDTAEDARFAQNPLVLGDPKIRFYAGMPIFSVTGLPVGTICVIDRIPRHLTDAQNAALEIFARQVNARLELRMNRKALATALAESKTMLGELQETKVALELANRRLGELAITDALTGLRNRRFFDLRLVEEFTLALHNGKKLSLGLFDVDDFKQRNDRYGHASGDTALQQLGRILRSTMRQTDVSVRYGGEEFGFLLPGTTVDEARYAAERLLNAVHAATWPDEPLTISIGVAEFHRAVDLTPGGLLARADIALYEAKRNGKNQYSIAVTRA